MISPSERYDRENEAAFRREVERALSPSTSKEYGPTASRPVRWPVNKSWFDTTLGHPIWLYNGTWVDAAGNSV